MYDESAAEMIFGEVRDLTSSFELMGAMRLFLFVPPYILGGLIAVREWVMLRRRKQAFELNVALGVGMTAAIAGGAMMAALVPSQLGLGVTVWTGLFMAGLPATLIVLAHWSEGFRRIFEMVEVAGAGSPFGGRGL